jgi:lipopolysaccharide transport system ATP-binding protein
MRPIIQVNSVSKLYRIQSDRPRYRTFQETIIRGLSSPFRNFKSIRGLTCFADNLSPRHGSHGNDAFWALKDVSFDVQPGEVVGIIGRNGAGKSTLLKVLSRITYPTSGEVKLYGRIASLLEVGTGFHPELTGRENIYLNGTILGMRRAEINRKFEEIVHFSEIEKFLDTPVKYYSSGMYIRLAFAVAAHLEPEILVIDEVLAVGDIAFQKKCLGKMDDVAKSGRTVLFVTHNMGSANSLCHTGLLLNKGEIVHKGKIGECIDAYLKLNISDDLSHTAYPKITNNLPIFAKSITILCNNAPSKYIKTGDDISFVVQFTAKNTLRNPKVGFIIYTIDGIPLLNANNRYQHGQNFTVPVTQGVLRCHLGQVPLMEGTYLVSFWLGDQSKDWHIMENILSFSVTGTDIWGTGQLPPPKVSHLWHRTKFECELGTLTSS